MTIVDDGLVLVRRLDVTARLTDQVVELAERPEGGILLETLIGRYVLDRDARVIWLLVDGRRRVCDIVADTAAATGLPVTDVRQRTHEICAQLLDLGLVQVATAADRAALRPMAGAG